MTATHPGERLTVRVIQDEAGWDMLRPEWEALYGASPYASTPLDFTWLREWWRVYGPVYGAEGLRVVTAWRGSQLIGALPLYLGRGIGGPLGIRRLRFVSTGEMEYEEICPDYLNLLCLPGEEVACAASVWDAIGRTAWDLLEFLDLPDDSPLLGTHEPFPGSARMEVFERGSCPIANLERGFEAYVEQLSAKTRARGRQELRKAERSGAAFELATGPDSDQFFDDLVRLHQERWAEEGKPGCFAARRFSDFHRSLTREWVPSGRAVLARLSHGGQVYAVLYGFVTRSRFELYQLGVKRADTGPFHSPGTAANLLLMSRLTSRGVTHYDFLRGASSFKQTLATEQRRLVGLRCYRATVRAAVYRSVSLLRRGGRKVVRIIGRK